MLFVRASTNEMTPDTWRVMLKVITGASDVILGQELLPREMNDKLSEPVLRVRIISFFFCVS